MKYLIPVAWSMYGRIEVEANSVEEAFEEADAHLNDYPLPEGFYLEDSFELDYDGIVMDEFGNIQEDYR